MIQIPKKGHEHLTPEKAYILGVLCGDGYMEVKRRRVRLGSVKDEDFVDIFKEKIIKQYDVRVCKYLRKSGYFDIFVCSYLVYEDLIRYDPTKEGLKTKTWRIPNEILNSDSEIKSNFLRGFCDSEMAPNPPYVRIFICSSNKIGLGQVKELLFDLGIESRIGFSRRKEEIYNLSITSIHYLNKFMETIGTSIESKKIKINKILQGVKNFSLRDGTYEKAMELRSHGLGHKRIAKALGIKEGLVRGWIYNGHNPYNSRGCKSLIKNLVDL